MAYDPVLDAWIQAGQPTKEEIFQYLKDNQESFNTDIEALKQVSQFDIIDVQLRGDFTGRSASELLGFMPVYRAPITGSITSAVITLLETSSSGTLAIMIEKSIDNGANWSPVLSSNIELTATTPGSISGAVNFIDVASQSFNQNDMLRISIQGIKSTQGAFHVSIYGERTTQ